MSLQQRHGDTVSRHLMGIDGQGNVTATPCQLYSGDSTPRQPGRSREPRPGHRTNERGGDTGMSLADTIGTAKMARQSACQSASGGRM